MDLAPTSPDWPAYCAEIAATPALLPGHTADSAGAGACPPVRPDRPAPAPLGHGLLARHWQALWPDGTDADSGPSAVDLPR